MEPGEKRALSDKKASGGRELGGSYDFSVTSPQAAQNGDVHKLSALRKLENTQKFSDSQKIPGRWLARGFT